MDRRGERTALFKQVSADYNAPRGSYAASRVGDGIELRSLGGGQRIDHAAPGASLTGPGFEVWLNEALLDTPVEFTIVNIDVAVESVQRRVRIEQGAGPDLVWIRFSDPDPEFAANFVNLLANSYQNHRARTAREAATRRRSVLANQLSELADSLQGRQADLLQYQRSAQLNDPTLQGSVLNTSLFEAENEMRTLRFQESLLGSVVAGLEREENDQTLAQVMALGAELIPQGPSLTERLQDLQIERSRLTASRFGFTENQPEVQVVDSLIASTRNQIRVAARQSLDLLRGRLRSAESRFGELNRQAGNLPGRTAEYGRLQQRVDAVQTVFNEIVNKYFEAQIAEDTEAGDIDIIGPARPPVRPLPTYAGLKLSAALLAGLLIGAVGAMLLEQLDTTIRMVDEVEIATGVDVIGRIPNIRSVSRDPTSIVIGKEGFRSIRTHLRFSPVKQLSVIAVTSAMPRDGKTTVAANLAITLAEQGSSVLLVDMDLRRPQVHATFGLDHQPGLSEVLSGLESVDTAIRRVEATSGLYVLPAGTVVHNATELIGGSACSDLVAELRRRYEYIVFDTPPVLAVTDALLASTLADGVLIVARANKTDRTALQNAVSQLRRVNASIIGIVLNDISARRSGYAYYPAYDSDGDEKQASTDPKGGRRFLLRS